MHGRTVRGHRRRACAAASRIARASAVSTKVTVGFSTGSRENSWVRRERIDKNPLDLLTRPRRKRRLPRVPLFTKVQEFIEHSADRRQKALLALMLYGALQTTPDEIYGPRRIPRAVDADHDPPYAA